MKSAASRWLKRVGRDRGASAVELAILAPALIFASLLIIQFALWFDARHAALAAAQEGDLVAREDAFANQAGWPALAQTAATSYYQGSTPACSPRSRRRRHRAPSRRRSR